MMGVEAWRGGVVFVAAAWFWWRPDGSSAHGGLGKCLRGKRGVPCLAVADGVRMMRL